MPPSTKLSLPPWGFRGRRRRDGLLPSPALLKICLYRNRNRLQIRAGCGRFVELCRRLRLFTDPVVAVDGSKFKPDNAVRITRLARSLGGWSRSTPASSLSESAGPRGPRRGRYRRGQVDPAEGEECRVAPADAGLEAVQNAAGRPVLLTDPDARSMATSGKALPRHHRLQRANRRRRHGNPQGKECATARGSKGSRRERSGIKCTSDKPALAMGVDPQPGRGRR